MSLIIKDSAACERHHIRRINEAFEGGVSLNHGLILHQSPLDTHPHLEKNLLCDRAILACSLIIILVPRQVEFDARRPC